MSNQPTIQSEIEQVEARVLQWKEDMAQAERDFAVTKSQKYLAQKFELADKIEKAERFLAEHRASKLSKGRE